MNIGRHYKSIQKIAATYRKKLDGMDEEIFTNTPPIGGWSFSEVYAHIFDSSLLSLMALQKAAKGEGEDKTTHLAVHAILWFGLLPPGKKYKVPARLADRVKKINTFAAQQFITDFELQLAKLFPLLASANIKSKVKHPRLGYLDAKQWIRFIEIHLNHHLKQIARIEKSFNNI
jgi:hypothetical protein